MKWRETTALVCLVNALVWFAVMPWTARDLTEMAVFVGTGFLFCGVGYVVAPSADRKGDTRG